MTTAIRSGSSTTTAIPRDRSFDSTLSMLTDPYRFVGKRCARNGTDVFETRLMLRKAVCAMGEDAARAFYQPERFTRNGAIPITALLLLQDKGSVQTLDAEAHRHRKQMLMSIMSPARIEALVAALGDSWRLQAERWAGMREVVLAREAQDVLCRAVCAWAGVPLGANEVRQRARELGSMYEGAGAVGPRNWRGQLLRSRTERWLRGLIDDVRAGKVTAPPGVALDIIARHRNLDGELLPTRHAAVELVNILRPTVAVERYVTFAAHALHEHPECAERIRAGADEQYVEDFVQEVRRFYPFFPLVGGRARAAFEWRGQRFEKGTWMLLDIYGTNHDPRVWSRPDVFSPERFRQWNGSPYNFIPQGGGDHFANHRCAGEWITIALMKRVVRLLAVETRYDVPGQDLSIDMSRMPAVPRSRFVMTNVRMVL